MDSGFNLVTDALAHPDALAVSRRDMANALRALAMDAVEQAKSGHPGMPMGMADVATMLFADFVRFDPEQPDWPDRDRFVLSAGHGSMLLYALLHLTGYREVTLDELKRFRQLGSRTAGHPEYGFAPGIETTTGPLGQGLANAVGMAIAERLLAARFSAALVDHCTYVIAGDGCLMEGIGHEAISLAGHLRLNKLIVLWDDNSISIDGKTDLAVSDDQLGRFRASGWAVEAVDGHDADAVAAALRRARQSERPSLIACRTTIACGAPTKAGTAAAHGAPLGAQEIAGARDRLGWPYPPFEIPEAVRAAWRKAGERGKLEAAKWRRRLEQLPSEEREAFEAALVGRLAEAAARDLVALKARISAERPSWATRVASQKALEVLNPAVPTLVGGSADLTGSNNTKTAGLEVVRPGTVAGRYIHYGVREHGMAAAMNGIALHGGAIPYGGTFLAFSDYCRPAIRLSALMHLRVIYVMTHDSIGLGEDGPTHQPVEHLAALRAMPNLNVFRPADAVETAEAWEAALRAERTPSVLCLSRQNLPSLRTEHRTENLTAMGAYVLAEASGGSERRKLTILATGSEVHLALEARDIVEAAGAPTAVVSMPCWELFEQQPAAYRESVLGPRARCIAIEAASPFGWTRYVEDEAWVIGIERFGASAPAEALFEKFGITAARVAERARARLAALEGRCA